MLTINSFDLRDVCNLHLDFLLQHSSTVGNISNVAGVSESADDDLPSVMTCANYLKLPPYSTKVSGDCVSCLTC